MRVLVTGGGGQLGRALRKVSWPEPCQAVILARDDLDICCADQVAGCLDRIDPRIIVNGAAWTAVDKAETHRDEAEAVNAEAPGILARSCHDRDIALIHISTDFVFSGDMGRAMRECDAIDPQSVYGASKARGETAIRAALASHLILRVAWLYGAGGKNFVTAILNAAQRNETLRVVGDQIGCPTACGDIAEVIATICGKFATRGGSGAMPWGTYHAVNSGEASWHRFAEEIVMLGRADPGMAGRLRVQNIEAIGTAEWPTPARRPIDSRLDCSLLASSFGCVLRPWQDALAAYPELILRLIPGSIVSIVRCAH